MTALTQDGLLRVVTVLDVPLLRKALERIDADPSGWRQGVWMLQFHEEPELNCRTVGCLAYHVSAAAGDLPVQPSEFVPLSVSVYVRTPGGRVTDVRSRAVQLLGISEEQADDLFSCGNSRRTLQRQAEALALAAGEELGLPLPNWA